MENMLQNTACSKDEAVTRLSDMGFKAINDSGVVMITIPTGKALKKAQKAIKDIGYKCSWGINVESENCNGE
ncbi:MAG: hypothetical protein J6S85_10265 [Methanobrevibacter sp.]|nr:hypothetical protein [Methanobrevibacter sp.]